MRLMTFAGERGEPSTMTGTPCSKPMTTSRGSSAVTFVMAQTPSGGVAHGSSISPHSIARPQRLSSIEYSFSFVAEIGISWRAAYSMASSRVSPQWRTGARISRSGARARMPTSKRTWSLPLPVQPWATASAPK